MAVAPDSRGVEKRGVPLIVEAFGINSRAKQCVYPFRVPQKSGFVQRG